jgi:hypothetical protein
MSSATIFKLLAGIALGVSALRQLLQHQTWWFIQNVNLIFHEAGHVLFSFFGNFMSILGGSLLEILIPLAVTLHFARSKQFFAAAFGCWWLATTLISVSIYASDAQERLLPLITGDVATHDWFNLLSQLNLLPYDNLVGYTFWLAGALSVVLLTFFLSRDHHVRVLLHRDTLG